MMIWMDGDACPKPIKAILFRAATRTQTHLTVVANHTVMIPPSPWMKTVCVPKTFDAADHYITSHMQANDLVITADVPLADTVVTNGGLALNPRGELYSINNIKSLLAARDRNECLRGAGLLRSGPKPLDAQDQQRFANQLDRLLSRVRRSHA